MYSATVWSSLTPSETPNIGTSLAAFHGYASILHVITPCRLGESFGSRARTCYPNDLVLGTICERCFAAAVLELFLVVKSR